MTSSTYSGAPGEIATGGARAATASRAPRQYLTGYAAQKSTVPAHRPWLLAALALGLIGSGAAPRLAQRPAKPAATPAAVKLYTLDGGLTEFQDAAVFSGTGEYDGKSLALPTPCYLIQHGADWLLWDTGPQYLR